MKKIYVRLLMIVISSFALFHSYLTVSAEEIESHVTVKIIQEQTLETESVKESGQESYSKTFPKTNELINPLMPIIGTMILIIGISGHHIKSKRNGANTNEKN